jgi:formylglycine-generating enzyme required for sulfatase activity
MKTTALTLLTLSIVLALPRPIAARNLTVSNATLTAPDLANHCAMVKFDLAWQDSWSDDAAWVFVKYRVGTGAWSHATLHASGHSGASFTVPADGKGVFVAGSASGTASYPSIQLRWDYGVDGVPDHTMNVTVRVFAVEMVRIPQGAFYIGDGLPLADLGRFFTYPDDAAPYHVTSEYEITIAAVGGALYYNNPQTCGDRQGPLPAAFPKGFQAFYCMKHEVTQQQYADFLNTLTAQQVVNRQYTGSSFGRYALTGSRPNITTTLPLVPCNYVSWMDGCAYADWAGLRPMTELEYEKACRGPLVPVPGERAWGHAAGCVATGLDSAGTASEKPSNPDANFSANNMAGVQGPLRAGAFAKPYASRLHSGAGYYGVLDMSGSLYEHPVSAGLPEGRAFAGSHGDGALSPDGYATNSDWPGNTAGEVTGAQGTGVRGASWATETQWRYDTISSRLAAAEANPNRNAYEGFRCVRTAP